MALVKYNYNSISAITSAGTVASGAMVLIKSQTASSSSSISFVHGTSDVVLDSTYPIYKFEFINIHPATATAELQFQANADGATGFNETMTTSVFQTFHYEDDSYTSLNYRTSHDQAQGTSYQSISEDLTDDADGCCSGELFLFAPSSGTYVKHFISTVTTHGHDSTRFTDTKYVSGYFNVTTAIDEIDFKLSTGNMDSGKIKLYGLKDS